MDPELVRLRVEMIAAAHQAGHAHLPSAFSILEIVYALYKRILRPEDKFILSKGHGVLALYAVLGQLKEYANQELAGHPERSSIIEATAGSLGHGLAIGAGIALAKKFKKESGRVFVLLGDQEAKEGSISEAASIIAELSLPVIAIVDLNTEEAPRWNGWRSIGVKGHNLAWGLLDELESYKPILILAHTVKGYGLREFEVDPGAWHHRALTDEDAERMTNAIYANFKS